MGVTQRAKQLKGWYMRHKPAVDVPLAGAGIAVAASTTAAELLATTPVPGGAAVATSAAIGIGTHKAAKYLAERLPRYAVQAVVGTYAAGMGTGVAIAHKVMHWNQDMLSSDFIKDAFLHTPAYLALIAASAAGAKAVHWAYEHTKPAPRFHPGRGMSRREMVKSGLRTTAAAASGVYLLGKGASGVAEYIADRWRRRGSADAVPGGLTLEVRVSDTDGKRDGMVSLEDRDIVNLSIKAKNAEEFNGRDLTLRYAMYDADAKAGLWDGSKRIPLGERSDLHIQNGEGAVEGMFEFSSTLEQSYDPTSPRINPLISDADGRGRFKFLVQAYDGGSLVGEKWWGGEDPATYTFNFERAAPETPVPRVPGKGGKKIFIYKQQLADTANDEQVFATADIWHPHMYDLSRSRGGGVRIRQIVPDRQKERVKRQAGTHGLGVLPMLSAFSPRAILEALDTPNSTASEIAEMVLREGYAGIAIDWESVRLNEAHSRDLNRFMARLRRELPRSEIAIAVSPRFAGSSSNGYRHHGFYNYGALAEHADFIELMAYDFHKGPGKAKSPVLPEDKIAPIVDYAMQHVPTEKVVMLMPLYGWVWTHRGRSVGPLSAVNVERFRKLGRGSYRNGELEIITPDRYITAQDRRVFERRLAIMDRHGVQNVGGWRQNHGTPGIYQELREWKARG